MGRGFQQSTTVDDLITAVEAATQGSRALDVQLAYCLGGGSGRSEGSATDARLPAKWHALGDFPAIAKIMLDEGFSWQSVCDVLDCEAPAFTTSLDAGLPGENIVFVIRSAKRNRWGAIHRTADGEEIFGWAATEALARRTAALKAWQKTLPATPEEEAPRIARSGAERDETPPQEPKPDPARADIEPRTPSVDGEEDEVPLEKSLEEVLTERENSDWEILF